MTRRSAVLLALAIAAGCGETATETTPTSGPTTTPSPTTSPTSGRTAPDAAVPTTQPATTPDPTTPVAPEPPPPQPPSPEPTTPPLPTNVVAIKGDILGRPDPVLLEALPAESIPWDRVGTDWLAVAYPRNTTTLLEETARQGLYLVDPDGRIYAASALPADGTDVVEVSWTGGVALLRGPDVAGLPLTALDLRTTDVAELVPRSEDPDDYALTRDGTGLWIYDLPWTKPPTGGGTASVSRIDLATLTRATLFEETVALDPLMDFYHWWVDNRGGIVELPSGSIMVEMPSGVWIARPDGSEPRRLDLPDAACPVVAVWDDATVVVRCEIAEGAQCEEYRSELWVVPVDGRSSTLLASPPADGCLSYTGAVPLGGHLAIDAGFGSGECNVHVLVGDPTGIIERWVPPVAEVSCNEWVVGVRDGAWSIQAANPYVDRDFPIALFDVTPEGAAQVELPVTWAISLTP